MMIRSGDIVLDYSRQKVDLKTMKQLQTLATQSGVEEMRQNMFNGEVVNPTEGRAALHVALRMPRDASVSVDGENVVPKVWKVLDSIHSFSDEVRSGKRRGCTGKVLSDVVSIGIGGSYLSVEFAHEALRTDPEGEKASTGRSLHFLANVDPVDVKRALSGFSAETTLVVVISKTFTTAETMLNAKTVRDWLVTELGTPQCVAKHVVACSTALNKTNEFGIDSNNVFEFWNWVGGRFSISSAVGVLPLSLQYGFDVVSKFLEGAHAMDDHFLTAPVQENLPMLMGLLAIWNINFMGYDTFAILPYAQALTRFAAHIQQLDMESNGKRVHADGTPTSVSTGGIYFGEPGTNGQHSFYQLLHHGHTVPAEFIGFRTSQNPIQIEGEPVSNHDELMANFFAQPDALALGRTVEELRSSGVPEQLIPHKTFPGDRPSLSLLLPACDAFRLGQLLAMYEHRTVVQAWVWNINPFDQYGVELGKGLAQNVRSHIQAVRSGSSSDFSGPASRLLAEYLK
jgi:glucose-6-phosphate isomerase